MKKKIFSRVQPTGNLHLGHALNTTIQDILVKFNSLNGLDVSAYHDFTDDVIGAVKFYGRSINGIDEDVRLTERLYIPRNRLRGFNTFKVGPRDGDDYIGGNYISSLGAEAQLPNLLPESYRTDFSLLLLYLNQFIIIL